MGDNSMDIPKSAIEELRNILQSEAMVEVTIEEAEKTGVALVNIYTQIFKPEVKGTHEQ